MCFLLTCDRCVVGGCTACFRDFCPSAVLPVQVPRVVIQTQLNARVLDAYFRTVDPEARHLRLVQFDHSQPDGSVRLQAYLPDLVHLKPSYVFQTLEQLLAHLPSGDGDRKQEAALPPVEPSPTETFAHLKSSKGEVEVEVVQVQAEGFAAVQSKLLLPTQQPLGTPGVWTPSGSQPPTPAPSPSLLHTPASSATADPFEAVASPALSQSGRPSKGGLLVRKLGPEQSELFVPVQRLVLDLEPVYRCVPVQQPAAEDQRCESKKRSSSEPQQQGARQKQRL